MREEQSLVDRDELSKLAVRFFYKSGSMYDVASSGRRLRKKCEIWPRQMGFEGETSQGREESCLRVKWCGREHCVA